MDRDISLEDAEARIHEMRKIAQQRRASPQKKPILPRVMTMKEKKSLQRQVEEEREADRPALETIKELIESRLVAVRAELKNWEEKLVEQKFDENGLPTTPRSTYSAKNAEKLKAMVNLLMQLDDRAMTRIRKEFEKRDWELTIYEFVLVMQQNMAHTTHSFPEIDALVEMFREIDVNGDESMQWEEFTSHLVQLASTYYQDLHDENVPHYQYVLIEDTSHHDYPCELVRYFRDLDRLVVLEQTSRRFKIYNKQLQCQRVVRGHRGAVLAAEYVKEHEMLVTSSADKSICFWDNRPGRKLELMFQWRSKRSHVALRWVENTLFSADTKGTIIAWNWERAEQKYEFAGHKDVVMDLCSLPNIGLLASASLDLTVRLWDIIKGVPSIVLSGHEKGVIYLAYSEEFRVLISGGLDNYALVWNPRVKSSIFKLKLLNPLAHVVGLEVNAANSELVIGDSRGGFAVFDLKTFSLVQSFSIPKLKVPVVTAVTSVPHEGILIACGKKLHKFKKTTGVKADYADDLPIQYAMFNEVSLTFITVAGRGVKIWDALTGRLERESSNLTPTNITAACLDDRKRRIFAGEANGDIKVFNYSSCAFMKKLDSHKGEISALVYCDNTKEILASSWDCSLTSHSDHINIKESMLRKAMEHTKDVTHLTTSAYLGIIASASIDMTVCIYEWSLGPLVHRYQIDNAPASSLVFLGRYPLLLVADYSGGLSLLDVTRGHHKRTVYIPGLPDDVHEHPRPVTCMVFDDSTCTLFTGDDAGYIKRWNIKETFLRHYSPIPVAYRPGKVDLEPIQVTWNDADKKAARENLKPEHVFRAHMESVNGMEMIDKNITMGITVILSWSYDGSVHLWNAITGQKLGSLLQGNTKLNLTKRQNWNFFINLDQHKRKETEFLEYALREKITESKQNQLKRGASALFRMLLGDQKKEKETKAADPPAAVPPAGVEQKADAGAMPAERKTRHAHKKSLDGVAGLRTDGTVANGNAGNAPAGTALNRTGVFPPIVAAATAAAKSDQQTAAQSPRRDRDAKSRGGERDRETKTVEPLDAKAQDPTFVTRPPLGQTERDISGVSAGAGSSELAAPARLSVAMTPPEPRPGSQQGSSAASAGILTQPVIVLSPTTSKPVKSALKQRTGGGLPPAAVHGSVSALDGPTGNANAGSGNLAPSSVAASDAPLTPSGAGKGVSFLPIIVSGK